MNADVQRAGWSRWLNWTPKTCISASFADIEPTKPTETGSDGFVGPASLQTGEIPPLEQVLKGRAVELYLADGQRFIVADEADAAKLGKPAGAVYTIAEVRRVVQIADPTIVAEVHRWKRKFDARTLKSIATVQGSAATTGCCS